MLAKTVWLAPTAPVWVRRLALYVQLERMAPQLHQRHHPTALLVKLATTTRMKAEMTLVIAWGVELGNTAMQVRQTASTVQRGHLAIKLVSLLARIVMLGNTTQRLARPTARTV